VLLRGINDDADVLERLFRGLYARGVKPYYLFQGDLARGTSHLRVPLSRGFELVAQLRGRLSGLAMPTYAVDLPGGGGKVPLTESYLEREEDDAYLFRSLEGELYRYPKEE
jgi:lysine 2,3-aminomutase